MILPLMPRPAGDDGGYEILCVGAHSDDIEIGCGGTLLRLLREWPIACVTWVVLSGNAVRAGEARRAARRVLGRRASARLVQAEFRESYFPYTAMPIKELFDSLGRETRPDLVLTHYRDDRHQDHRLVSELTYNTFRDHLIVEYEIVKVDGDIGNPNLYVPLNASTVRRKVDILQSSFSSQSDKRWFSDDVFRGLMRLRGMEAGAASGYAEAFYVRKLLI
jgi:LmbE family N-acetylglucosaminyl deacetylase